MISRRKVLLALGSGALAAPIVAFAQQRKVWRIGMLESISKTLNAANLDAFRQGLRELGYVEGQNVVIDHRSADGRQERFPDLATELVRLKVDLIVARGAPAALAAKSATRTIPVVMTSAADPVGSGIVASLARPGGNVTGLSGYNVEINAKRLELLRELVPKLARVAGLFNTSNPGFPLQWKEVERAARSLGVQLQLLDVRNPEDFGRAFDAATRQRVDALVVTLDSVTLANRRRIVDLAAKHRLPAIYGSAEFVDAGGLITYAVNYPHLYYRAATYVDKILKGIKPADLPVEQPTKFELVINQKTAKTLGITIPQSLILQADRVID